MEAVHTSDTSVHLINVTTQRYISEASKLHTRRREDLKSHKHNLLHVEKELHSAKCQMHQKLFCH
jgi:hypothetical protein